LRKSHSTYGKGSTDPRLLRKRMSAFMASGELRVAYREKRDALEAIGRAGLPLPHLDSITVGSWDHTESDGNTGSVEFTGFKTVSGPDLGVVAQPLQEFTVAMRTEGGRWKLVRAESRWLTPAGPMEVVGTETIRDYPQKDRLHEVRNGLASLAARAIR